jgi:signal transduction histidine kinase
MTLLAEDGKIAMTCDASKPVAVKGDRARLKQVIVNLLDNAIKYTQFGGTVRLSVCEAGPWACMEVTDTGVGIAPDALSHVFDRFFRADSSRSREPDGVGLGLAIVRSICGAHGGTIEAESVPGRGSRFLVKLPLTVDLSPISSKP